MTIAIAAIIAKPGSLARSGSFILATPSVPATYTFSLEERLNKP